MEKFIYLFLLLPVFGFLVTMSIKSTHESYLSKVAFFTVGLSLVSALGFIAYWVWNSFPVFSIGAISLYKNQSYDFFLEFYFDRVTAVYLLVGAILTFLVTIYSRSYMHRESGYKRFFGTILFFYIGYNFTILSGNFETLFIGWEVLGISSFLLIAFYRTRYLPVKNALKVFTIYRIGDVGILLAMWMSHHLWHENVTFIKLANFDLVHDQLLNHSNIGVFISLMILIAAAAKSAQLPFSAWLPRAMEGPTPSSAIFYGSLSVHIGAFLLMRTFPFWEHQELIRWLIAILGLFSAIILSLIARVQSTIKSQIAYGSAAQIGIIFIEISIGWEILALVHFAGNAFLRTYQLLISPSVVTYLIREQFYNYTPEKQSDPNGLFTKVKNAIYLWSLKEWNLDTVIFKLVFRPLKWMRKSLVFINLKNLFYFFIPLYIIGFVITYLNTPIPAGAKNYLAVIIAFLALIMVAKSYNERTSSRLAWILIVLAHFFVDLAITLNDHFDGKEALVYLSGVIVSGLIGYYCLNKIKTLENQNIGLNSFHGLIQRHKSLAMIFFLSCLGIAGFPITTTFFGEDLILTHIQEGQVVLALLVALIFILNGISAIRIYARVFLGHQELNLQSTSTLTN